VTRQFTNYIEALNLFYEEELNGLGYFEELASYYKDNQKKALNLMKEIEVIVVNRLQPLIKKYKLQKNKDEINYFILEGKKEAKLQKEMIWKEFLASIIKTYPSYTDEFEQIINLAPYSDKEFLKLLYEHEQVFIDFAQEDIDSNPASLSLLKRFISEHKNDKEKLL
jgi:hypothetical protein